MSNAQPADAISAVLAEIAPYGVLHFAINLGNPILAQSVNGRLQGVSVALAKKLAEELNVTPEFHSFDAAGKVVAALADKTWSVAFLAIEPVRADVLTFSQPYVNLQGTYLVKNDSPYQSVTELDKSGVQLYVGKGAAYDLFLSRTLQAAQLVRSDTSALAVSDFMAKPLDAVAGVRSYLEEIATQYPDYRVLPDSFNQIQQAIATPKANIHAANYLNAFIARQLDSGFIRQALIDSGQSPTLAVK